jgi:zinc transporter, ZIP family
MSPISAWYVFWVALGTDLATGLGAVPFFFVRRLSDRWQGLAYAVAGGMMISAAVFSLAEQGLGRGATWVMVLGMLTGSAFYALTARLVARHEWRIEQLSAQESRQSVLMLGTMFVHSIPEGVAIGVGYATGRVEFGLLLALAIAVHNVPEGIAVSLPLRAKGVSVLRCAGYAILTSVPQPIAAVPAFLLVEAVAPLLPFGLGFAGGAMIFLVAAELIPESLERCTKTEMAWGTISGLTLMLLLTAGLEVLTGGPGR